jgi:hypothetical protein
MPPYRVDLVSAIGGVTFGKSAPGRHRSPEGPSLLVCGSDATAPIGGRASLGWSYVTDGGFRGTGFQPSQLAVNGVIYLYPSLASTTVLRSTTG